MKFEGFNFWRLSKPVQAIITIVIALPIALLIINAFSSPLAKRPLAKSEASYETSIVRFELHQRGSRDYLYTIGRVTNTGTKNLYLGSGKMVYTDKAGSVIQVDDYLSAYPDIIAPGESAYYIDNSGYKGTTRDIYVELMPDVRRAKNELIRYDVSDVKLFTDSNNRLTITGYVNNASDKGTVYVVALLFGKDNKEIGMMHRIISAPRGAKSAFEIEDKTKGGIINYKDIDSYIIWAYPWQVQVGN